MSSDTTERHDQSSSSRRFVARLEDLEAAAVTLAALLDRVTAGSRAARAAIAGGVPASELVLQPDANALRKELHAATRNLERKVQRLRGESIRMLVDTGMTITETARVGGFSAQMARRLYGVALDEEANA